VDADDVRLDLTRLTALSLIVNEVMSNSLKHAFKGRSGGTITLDLKRMTAGRVALTVADDGPGFPAAAPCAASLGLKIVRGLAAQLGGEVSTPPVKGTATRIEFAA
jgi:two-component sensor histidine kinase